MIRLYYKASGYHATGVQELFGPMITYSDDYSHSFFTALHSSVEREISDVLLFGEDIRVSADNGPITYRDSGKFLERMTEEVCGKVL